jgi:ankyrin repeat protein
MYGKGLSRYVSIHEYINKIYFRLLYLLKAFPDLKNFEDVNGNSFLHLAVNYQSPKLVQLLLDLKIDINKQNMFN